MDGLRWLLLLFGLLVIAGVYWYSVREQKKKTNADLTERRAPTLATLAGKDSTGDWPDTTAIGEGDSPTDAESVLDDKTTTSRANSSEQKIVALRLVARNGGVFKGDELIFSLRGIGMRHGKFGIFHRLHGSDEDNTIFSAASLVEPGSFDLSNIKDQEIPGISLFLVLPGPIDGADAFDLMMAAARTLSQSLNAELLDETGSTLSIQRERYLREEIVQFEHSNKVA